MTFISMTAYIRYTVE